jgi:hypothetical protein
MSLEAWSALAQIGTFAVIAATAVAALVQLNHLRAANALAASNLFIQEYEGPELRDAFSFVRTQLKQALDDPAFREELRSGHLDRAKHPEIMVCNFFDQWGGYYRTGAIDRTMFMRHNAGVVLSFWQRLEPVVALAARDGVNRAFEQFEYVAVQAQDWEASHAGGDYPKAVRRMPLTDPWRDLDRRNGSSGA